jgi:hypothetical protein
MSVARHLFWHPAHATVGVCSPPDARDFAQLAEAVSERSPARICLVADSAAPAAGLRGLLRQLTADERLCCFQPFRASTAGIPVLSDWEQIDCCVLLSRPADWRRHQWLQLETIARWRPVVALAGACRDLPHADYFRQHVLGMPMEQASPRPIAATEIRCLAPPAVKGHPIVADVPSLAAAGPLPLIERLFNSRVLLCGSAGGHARPVAWIRRSPGGRVFCTSLSATGNFDRPAFQHLVTNAIHWACSLT